ncbi:MAG: hypothetical protein HY321_13340 [Armatimonadetes bacterium]|nr:hypothetical protein [Armatimonadota bacterium]
MEIWTGKRDHRNPYPGDHGIQFEEVSLEEAEAALAAFEARVVAADKVRKAVGETKAA